MDSMLTLLGLTSFISLVIAWVGLPHTAPRSHAPQADLQAAPQTA